MLTHDNRDARGALNIQPCYVSKLKRDDDELIIHEVQRGHWVVQLFSRSSNPMWSCEIVRRICPG